MNASLYLGTVMHRRFVPPLYGFRYRLFQLLLDIDTIDRDLRALRLLSRNRFNVFSFHDRDHGPKDGTALRPWIDATLARFGLDLAGGRVRLLCMPRVLGYGFNPLSVWYCHHSDGTLRAVLCEVRNTFGEWHGYLLHDGGAPLQGVINSSKRKCFHVSPFFPVSGSYAFRLTPPSQRLSTVIRLDQDGSPRMLASQVGERYDLTDARLLRLAVTQPLQSIKVIAAIHWQALKLWLRGARFHRKPPRPEQEIN
ncbi:DUF1365 family protein [Natronocella acetinitrilica]|uniref:DUF1365 family protein n=1 Tax=Natronocella acetinitrilica TaxID=414046 RepID=A0AAE3K9S4_9GAMM|nr:DUF1365 domain-containing protein [Natronocella acetinitrilica]MCP1673025.1 DUF1365 family protein [Natronocella acetinitrilica]